MNQDIFLGFADVIYALTLNKFPLGIRTYYDISEYMTSLRRLIKIYWFIEDILKMQFCFAAIERLTCAVQP